MQTWKTCLGEVARLLSIETSRKATLRMTRCSIMVFLADFLDMEPILGQSCCLFEPIIGSVFVKSHKTTFLICDHNYRSSQNVHQKSQPRQAFNIAPPGQLHREILWRMLSFYRSESPKFHVKTRSPAHMAQNPKQDPTPLQANQSGTQKGFRPKGGASAKKALWVPMLMDTEDFPRRQNEMVLSASSCPDGTWCNASFPGIVELPFKTSVMGPTIPEIGNATNNNFVAKEISYSTEAVRILNHGCKTGAH